MMQQDNVPKLGLRAPCIAPYPTGHNSPYFTLKVREQGKLLKPATFRMLHTLPSGKDYAALGGG